MAIKLSYPTFKKSSTLLSFRDDTKLLGKLYMKNGKLAFEGDVDKSAEVFVARVLKIANANKPNEAEVK